MAEENFFNKSEFEGETFEEYSFSDLGAEEVVKGKAKDKPAPPAKTPPGGFISYQEEDPMTPDERFRDIGFIQDYSIVSSVEDYAMRVRLDADEYAQNKIKEADQYHETNQRIIQTKKRELENARILIEDEIRKLTEERDKVYDRIKKEAYKEGFREGKNEILDKSDQNIQLIAGITEDLDGFYRKLLARYEKDLMETALLIAGKILRTEITANDEFIRQTVQDVIKQHRDEGTVKLYINPADYELLKEKDDLFTKYIDRKDKFSVELDEEVSCGTVKIETDIFYRDSDITLQLEQIKSEIRKAYNERLMRLSQQKDY